MEKDRKRNMDRCPLEELVPLHAPNGGPGLQHSMCPDWELGIRSRSSHLSICRDNAQPTEAHQSGLTGTFMNKFPTNEAILIHQQKLSYFKYIKHLEDFMDCFNPKFKNTKIFVNWVLMLENDIAMQTPKRQVQRVLLLFTFQRREN